MFAIVLQIERAPQFGQTVKFLVLTILVRLSLSLLGPLGWSSLPFPFSFTLTLAALAPVSIAWASGS